MLGGRNLFVTHGSLSRKPSRWCLKGSGQVDLDKKNRHTPLPKGPVFLGPRLTVSIFSFVQPDPTESAWQAQSPKPILAVMAFPRSEGSACKYADRSLAIGSAMILICSVV